MENKNQTKELAFSEYIEKVKKLIFVFGHVDHEEFLDSFIGFLLVNKKLLLQKSGGDEFDSYEQEICFQIKNQEILKECKNFFKSINENSLSIDKAKNNFAKVGMFLLFDVDEELTNVRGTTTKKEWIKISARINLVQKKILSN